MTVNNFETVPYPKFPIANVTPFTYRDGHTYLEILENLRVFINDTLVPFVNEHKEWVETSFTQWTDELQTQIDNWETELVNGNDAWKDSTIQSFNTQLSQFQTSVQAVVDTINEKTGSVPTQSVTLTGDTVLSIDPTFPNNQPATYRFTQDAVGSHSLTLNPVGDIAVDAAPGSVTIVHVENIAGVWQLNSVETEYVPPVEGAYAFVPNPSGVPNIDNNVTVTKSGNKYRADFEMPDTSGYTDVYMSWERGANSNNTGEVWGTTTTTISPGDSVVEHTVRPSGVTSGAYAFVTPDNRVFYEQLGIGVEGETTTPLSSSATNTIPVGSRIVRPLKDTSGVTGTNVRVNILDKVSYRQILTTIIDKNVEIVPVQKDSVWVCTDALVWTKYDDGVWNTTRTNPSLFVDGRIKYSKASTLTECLATPGTWIDTGAGNIYVHTLNGLKPDNVNTALLLGLQGPRIENQGSAGNVTFVIKDVRFIGGQMFGLGNSSSKLNLYLRNCSFEWAGHLSSSPANGVNILGNVDFYAKNVRVLDAGTDAFNYHVYGGRLPQAVEIECVAERAGATDNPGGTHNGSTMHDGGSVLRVGGVYGPSNGPVIADVNAGTVSANYGAIARASATSSESQRSSFQGEGEMTMKLFGCQAIESPTAVRSTGGAEIEVFNTVIEGGINGPVKLWNTKRI